MIGELRALKELTKMIIDNPMESEYNSILEATLNALPYPIFIIDSLYNIKFANNYLLLYFDIDLPKIIDKKCTDVLLKRNNLVFNSLSKTKNFVGLKDSFSLSKMKKFPIFNKNNKTIGYICVIDPKQDFNSDFELKQSVLYANSILSTTTFNAESIAVHCDWKSNLNITEVFSSINKPQSLFWLKGKSYIDDITHVADRQTIESYVKTLKETKNKNIMWNSRVYNKENTIVPVQQYMSLQNGNLLIHIASMDKKNIEIELS